jgi:hypothetical protein
MSRDPSQRILDLGSLKGVREHFNVYGEIPTLVFRDTRRIDVILNPFPGIRKLTTPGVNRSLIPGSNTYSPAIELVAGERVVITRMLSPGNPFGPVIQVAMDLVGESQEVALSDETSELTGIAPARAAGGAR